MIVRTPEDLRRIDELRQLYDVDVPNAFARAAWAERVRLGGEATPPRWLTRSGGDGFRYMPAKGSAVFPGKLTRDRAGMDELQRRYWAADAARRT